jgi:hypothetical protein
MTAVRGAADLQNPNMNDKSSATAGSFAKQSGLLMINAINIA